MILEDYYYVCSFQEEFDIIKKLESLGFDIMAKPPLYCCDENAKVTFRGDYTIHKNLTAQESMAISNYIANSVGIHSVHPYITTDGEIIIRFVFYSVVREPYVTKDNFNLFEHYKMGY